MTSRFVRPVRPGGGDAARLDSCAEEVRGELRRADTKASMLLALAGAGVAVAASSKLLTADDTITQALAGGGTAFLVAAVIALLLVVRPRLATAPFMQDPSAWRPESPRQRVLNLSAVARLKFTRVRVAVDLLLAGTALLGAAVLWTGVAS